MNQHDNQGVIEVETKFFVLAFLLLLFKPQVSIDGRPPQQVPWGTSAWPVLPGTHRVTVFLPYLFLPRMGESSIDVQVGAGQAVKVRWFAPLVIFMAGSMKILGAGPANPGAFAGPTGGYGAPAGQAPPATYGNQSVAPAPGLGNQPPPAAAPPAAQQPLSTAPASAATGSPTGTAGGSAGGAGGGIAAGWYSDPSTKHELRYYDGTRWTEHVSDGGQVSTDAS